MIKTSSKEALLRSALAASGNDIKKATEIVEYFTSQLPSMPETDPITPTTFEQMRDTAMNVLKWGEENQDKLAFGLNMLMNMINKK